jgi:hypothetical protein
MTKDNSEECNNQAAISKEQLDLLVKGSIVAQQEALIKKQKEQQEQEYKKIMSKLTDKQLQKEVYSYRRYFDKNSKMFAWRDYNPDDFLQSDKLIILRELLEERGLEEL